MPLLHRLTARPQRADALFALVVGVLVIGCSFPTQSEQPDRLRLDTAALALLALGALALVVRRRWAVLACATTFAVVAVFIGAGYPYGPLFLYVMITVYSLAAWRSTRWSVSVTAVLVALYVWLSAWVEKEPDGVLFNMATTTFWLATPLVAGIAVRMRRLALEQSAIEERRRHAYEERLRMAQEVHDVVGHSLAVISMNAGAALHVLSRRPDTAPQVEESLRAIRQTSTAALDELRVTLSAFTGACPAPDRPAAGLGLLPELVAATTSERLAVRLTVHGPTRPVRHAVDLAGYRIVQEALTNVLRHAAARQATVEVAYGPHRVALTVADDGRGGAPQPGGSGLDSMRERARALHGVLDAGPLPGGGFRVHAVLPYGDAPDPDPQPATLRPREVLDPVPGGVA
ncbi:sensor histidine kinase [Catellatospora citrea]|uniref:histidine kinase n=1 Tax=Catellatospora citrea TaxID=53366 RepID=A0A8J3P0T0_9ACTN|nr:sensor histidine kinase [Catellatospora citrea]RKE10334.1 MYXO-CTERM domain-containing protein [Catellatospora citrea]GIF99161.1 two-component sensor histidine kinase [Catellatospora citrea]